MFRSLALGGGGVRAGLHVGALTALESLRGSLVFPDGIWGCSAGAVLATAVAFNLSAAQVADLYRSHMDISAVIPTPKLSALADLATSKGMFSMEIYERAIVTAFKTHGIDLTDKVIADAPQPLYIVASNMTTHNPTVFTKHVRILDALRCSSCLPILFQPQVLYNHVYLDGGLFVDCLSSLTPRDCLVLHISDPGEKLYASELETLPLSTYLHRIYRSMRGRPSAPNVLWLQNSSVGLLQEMTPEQKDALCAQGTSQTLAFMAKRLAKERQEPVDGALAGKVGEDGTGL
jgi:hypothetical protein